MAKIFKFRHQVPLKSYAVKKVLLDPAMLKRANADPAATWLEMMKGPLRKMAQGSKDNDAYDYALTTFYSLCNKLIILPV